MARIEAVKREWLAQTDEIRRQTDGQVSRYTGKNYEGWLAKIADWAQDEASGYAIPKELERFGQTVLEENLKKGARCRPCRSLPRSMRCWRVAPAFGI